MTAALRYVDPSAAQPAPAADNGGNRGGLLGIALGLAVALPAGRQMGIPFAPNPLAVAGAFVFSGVVGVIFGDFPARRAARLDPIEAL